MLLWWGDGGQREFVSRPERFKKENQLLLSVFLSDQRIHQNTGCLITYQHFWCLFARQRERKKMIFWCCERYIPAPLSWSPGGNSLLSSDLWKVWWISSESVLLYASLFILSHSLLFVRSRSQTGLRAGPQGWTCSSLFDLPGLPFGSLENRGMKVNCKFL